MNERSCTHLTDLLDAARIEAPHRAHVQLQNFVIQRTGLATVFQHPPSRIVWPEAEIHGPDACLEAHIGVKPSVWERIGSPVWFRVLVRDGKNETPVFEQRVDARHDPRHRAWLPVKVELGAWQGRKVCLVFETRALGDEATHAWVGWGDPRLLMPAAAKPPQSARRKNSRPDIILITCDALRLDHLGCYGAPPDRTPNLDRLAREGLPMRHARAQTDTTFGSYVTMLTGLMPHETGQFFEWGVFPAHTSSLPVTLAAAGYRTLLAASEDEFAAESAGVNRIFHEQVPCLGNPAQSSAITIRRLLAHLERTTGDEPRFVWLQLFEPHPPQMPEPQFAQRFFTGDPGQEFESHRVAQIHGVESSLELATSRPQLALGIVPMPLLIRIKDALRALRGNLANGPDLASHLEALGPPAWNGLEREKFLDWLHEEVSRTAKNNGRAAAEFLGWLDRLEELLRHPESDLLSWLDDVRDCRYPEALYAASVASVDHWVGELLNFLRISGRYDDALIVFTAPHGEFLHDAGQGMNFEHHLPAELVLRVPLIIKLPAACAALHHDDAIPVGLVDLGATILRLAGIPATGTFAPERSFIRPLDERNRESSRTGAALSMSGAWAVLTRGAFKLVRSHFDGNSWPLLRAPKSTDAGGTLLFAGADGIDETRDVGAEHPGVLQELTLELRRLVPRSASEPSLDLEPVRFRDTTRRGSDEPKLERHLRDAQDHRTVTERSLRAAKSQLRAMRKEIERLHKDRHFLTRLVENLRDALGRLFQSRRWRLVNLLRGSAGRGYAPVDSLLKRLAGWKPRSADARRDFEDKPVSYTTWLCAQRPAPEEALVLRSRLESLTRRPCFGLVLHLPPEGAAECALQSVKSLLAQWWTDWRLLIVDAPGPMRALLPQEPRIIFDDSGEALPAEVTHVAAFGAGDLLEDDALAQVALHLSGQKDPVDLVWTDEDEVSEKGDFSNPFFKPAWSPDTLESLNCVGSLAVYRRDLLTAIGAGAGSFHPHRAYDLVLRAAEQPGLRAERLPRVLYHRRGLDPDACAALQNSDLEALRAALGRRGEPAVAAMTSHGIFHVRRAIYKHERVSILIPTRDRLELLRRCVETLTAVTRHGNYEVVILNNESREPWTLEWLARCGHRVLDFPGPFHYAAMHNAAVRSLDSPWLCFLNNDTEIIEPHWLGAMCEQVQRPEIAAVGAKLLFPDGLVQHAGVVLGIQGRAAHAFAGMPAHYAGARAQLHAVRNYSAVTAACMMMRRAVFEELGGFDEKRFPVAYNDVELCVRALRRGYRNVFTPHAMLKHHECATRPRVDNPNEVAALRKTCLGGPGWTDPFFHPKFDHESGNFELGWE